MPSPKHTSSGMGACLGRRCLISPCTDNPAHILHSTPRHSTPWGTRMSPFWIYRGISSCQDATSPLANRAVAVIWHFARVGVRCDARHLSSRRAVEPQNECLPHAGAECIIICTIAQSSRSAIISRRLPMLAIGGVNERADGSDWPHERKTREGPGNRGRAGRCDFMGISWRATWKACWLVPETPISR